MRCFNDASWGKPCCCWQMSQEEISMAEGGAMLHCKWQHCKRICCAVKLQCHWDKLLEDIMGGDIKVMHSRRFRDLE